MIPRLKRQTKTPCVVRFRRRGSFAARRLRTIRRVQVLGGPMHGYTLLWGKRCFHVLDTDGRKTDLDFSDAQNGYDWQRLPSGEERFVCRTTPQAGQPR